MDNCSKINDASKCGVIDDLLIVEKAENNVSHIRLKDRTDHSNVLENNFEDASITEHNVLDSPRNGESRNIETSNSIDHVCTQNVLAKKNFVDTDVISSNNSSLADSVKTVSEQEGLSSSGLEANDEVEPVSLDLEDPTSTPDILQQLDDDFYNYEQFKDSTEWDDTVCDEKMDVTVTVLQTDYLNDKPNSMDTECNIPDEIGKTYTPYSENETCVNDKSAFIHDERTISSFVTSQELNVEDTNVFRQPDCEFSIQPKYIEMYDVIANTETSNEKSGKAVNDSFSFDFTFNDDAVREESNLDTSVHTHIEDIHFRNSSTKSDASTFPNNFCDIADVKNTVQSKESEYVAVETKNQTVQKVDVNGTSEEISVYEEKESNNEEMRKQYIPENDFDVHDLDNSDFTEFMEHRDFNDVSELTNDYNSISSNSTYETVQIHDLHTSPSDTSCIQKFSPIKGVSLPSTNTSLDCLKNKVNITNTEGEKCATYESENSVVYFSDGEFYDFHLRTIEPAATKAQEDSCPRFESANNGDDDFGDFTNFSSTAVEWKSDDAKELKVPEDDDDFGDFSNFETTDVVEIQQFSLKDSMCRIENKNVSLGMFCVLI